MAVVPQPEAGRRIRAARAYRGLSSVGELAAKTGRGLKATKLYALERGEQPLRRPDALAIAEACMVPVAFFEVDFSRLGELVDRDPAVTFEQELRDADEPSGPPADSNGEDGPPQAGEAPR